MIIMISEDEQNAVASGQNGPSCRYRYKITHCVPQEIELHVDLPTPGREKSGDP